MLLILKCWILGHLYVHETRVHVDHSEIPHLRWCAVYPCARCGRWTWVPMLPADWRDDLEA